MINSIKQALETLEVDTFDTFDDIKSAYVELAKIYNTQNISSFANKNYANQKMKMVDEAYRFLTSRNFSEIFEHCKDTSSVLNDQSLNISSNINPKNPLSFKGLTRCRNNTFWGNVAGRLDSIGEDTLIGSILYISLCVLFIPGLFILFILAFVVTLISSRSDLFKIINEPPKSHFYVLFSILILLGYLVSFFVDFSLFLNGISRSQIMQKWIILSLYVYSAFLLLFLVVELFYFLKLFFQNNLTSARSRVVTLFIIFLVLGLSSLGVERIVQRKLPVTVLADSSSDSPKLAEIISHFEATRSESGNKYNWEKVCAKFKYTIPENEKVPVDAGFKCKAHEFYYGFFSEPDYSKAIDCAQIQIRSGDHFLIGGSGILMMVYANGFGVPKDIEKAIMHACNIQGSDAEMESRIDHLQKLRDTPSTAIVDICEDATSGKLQGECQFISYGISKKQRDEKIKFIISSWSSTEKLALTKLRQSAEDFFELRTVGELDSTPSARWMFVYEEKDALEEKFLEMLKEMDKGVFKYSKASMDEALNTNYKELLPKLKLKKWSYTPDVENVRKTQRTWMKYRDEWLQFSRLKYPEMNHSEIAAALTEMRNDHLVGHIKNN